MEKAVASHPDAKWRVVAFHHDIYGSGAPHSDTDGANLRPIFAPLMDKFDIDVCLTGHDHSYARTIALEPEVILMDEATSALDPISTAKMEELMVELKKQYTVVLVTHNMQQASRVADRTAFFFLGDLIEYGDTEQIFGAPVQEKTKAYVSGQFG